MPKNSFHYFDFPKDLNQNLLELKNKPASFWEARASQKVLALFKFTYKTTPAYQRFLKNYNIDGQKIKTIEDFKTLPLISKETYLRKNNFIDLFPWRDISKSKTISATSGSTGEPFYFPRGEEQDHQYEYLSEIFLKNQFQIDKKTTLGIIGFGLGIWIGGIFTYKNFNKISEKGLNLTLAPVGNNIDTYLNVIKKFGHLYDQIILMGYAPFIKDIIDEGKSYGIDWQDYNLRILTAAEGYSEKFKEYIIKKTGIKNLLTDFINIYGTVEIGTMAHETPLSNLIRKKIYNNNSLAKKIFPNVKGLPTLAQYHPYLVYFEEYNKEVIASGYGSSLPLLRYRFHDLGGVIGYDEMIEKFKQEGIDILEEAKHHKIEKTILKLPFVYVYERSDHVVILRGANIYPQEIKNALHHRALEKFITGKFSVIKKEDRKLDEYLEINIELKNRIKKSKKLEFLIQEIIKDELTKTNSEFSYLYSLNPSKLTPAIVLWSHRHEKYFSARGKQKWVIK